MRWESEESAELARDAGKLGSASPVFALQREVEGPMVRQGTFWNIREHGRGVCHGAHLRWEGDGAPEDRRMRRVRKRMCRAAHCG